MNKHKLPFEVGQSVEIRSFLSGFRSAWFRCKIMKIHREMSLSVEHCDFPDEKIQRIKAYQCPPGKKSKEVKRELMVRPCFPHVCQMNEMPDNFALSAVAVVVPDVWKIGDLVDWFFDGCYWSGKVINMIGKDKVEVELPPPPVGEGLTYKAFIKDLRPSLNWSPDDGWTMPLVTEGEQRCRAWIMKPMENQGGSTDLAVQVADDQNLPISSCSSASSSPLEQITGQPLALSITAAEEILKIERRVDTSTTERSLPPKDRVKQALSAPENEESLKRRKVKLENEVLVAGGSADFVKSIRPPEITGQPEAMSSSEEKPKIEQKMDTGASEIPSPPKDNVEKASSIPGDTTEDTIVDLEELLNGIKWLKRVVEAGTPLYSHKPVWKFTEAPPK